MATSLLTGRKQLWLLLWRIPAWHLSSPTLDLLVTYSLSQNWPNAPYLISYKLTCWTTLYIPYYNLPIENRTSTETALIKVQNDILMNMDRQQVTLLVLLDLSAAFDTIDHQVLLDRLRLSFGIRGCALQWISSYLSDRTQRVSFENNFSQRHLRYLSYGVPQGSCLGPLLFTMYASKLFDIIKGYLPQTHAYADDTQLYLSFKPDTTSSQSDAVYAMERCIRAIRCWMIKDKLKVNDSKTEFILIGTRQQLVYTFVGQPLSKLLYTQAVVYTTYFELWESVLRHYIKVMNLQPQRTQISTVAEASFIQYSNWMTSSVEYNCKFSELTFSTPATSKATSKLFRSLFFQHFLQDLKISQFNFAFAVSSHSTRSNARVKFEWCDFLGPIKLLLLPLATNEIASFA